MTLPAQWLGHLKQLVVVFGNKEACFIFQFLKRVCVCVEDLYVG